LASSESEKTQKNRTFRLPSGFARPETRAAVLLPAKKQPGRSLRAHLGTIPGARRLRRFNLCQAKDGGTFPAPVLVSP